MLQPKPAGAQCPKCGTEGVFVNRSALIAGLARCPIDSTEIKANVADTPPEPAHQVAVPTGNGNGFALGLRLGIGGAALAGVVVGTIATLLLTRRE